MILKHRRFKFENTWLHEPDIEDVVQRGWNCGITDSLLSKLECCVMDLDQWDRKLRGKYKDEIDKC